MELDRIYNEDCLEGMKRIPDGVIDAIITDPPYCVGASSNGIKSTYCDYSLIKPFFQRLFSEFARVTKSGAAVFVHTDWRTYPYLYSLFAGEFAMRNLIVWDYEYIKCGNFYRYSYELLMYGTKGKSERQFDARSRDVWRLPCYRVSGREHPSQKPVQLIEKMLLENTNEGELVLDAFMGSGTTAVAAINTDRHYVGFELHEPYCEICERRIGEARMKRAERLVFE